MIWESVNYQTVQAVEHWQNSAHLISVKRAQTCLISGARLRSLSIVPPLLILALLAAKKCHC